MPQDGSNNYQYPAGTRGVTDQTIESEKYNTFLDDLVVSDLNWPRPVHRGGTGASNAADARDNLELEVRAALVTNYDSHVFEPGSFYSNPGAPGAPLATGHFSGWCYWVNVDVMFLEVRWHGEALTNYPRKFVRHKYTTWSVWFEESSDINAFVKKAGDFMTGPLAFQTAGATKAVIFPDGSANFSTAVRIGAANPALYYMDATFTTVWATAGYVLSTDTYKVSLAAGVHYAQLTGTGAWDVNILQFNHDPQSFLKYDGTYYALQMYSGTVWYVDAATSDWWLRGGSLPLMYLAHGTRQFYVYGDAFKPEPGMWLDSGLLRDDVPPGPPPPQTRPTFDELLATINDLKARVEQLESGA